MKPTMTDMWRIRIARHDPTGSTCTCGRSAGHVIHRRIPK